MTNQTPQSTFDERLDEIVHDVYLAGWNDRLLEANPKYEPTEMPAKSKAKAAIKALVLEEVIGEDERLDIQSDFDKIDVPHLETDRYPGLDGVRQASRNILRAQQRSIITKGEK